MYQNAIVTTDGSELAATALKHVPQVTSPDGKVTVIAVVDSVGQVIAKTTPAGFELAAMTDGRLTERSSRPSAKRPRRTSTWRRPR